MGKHVRNIVLIFLAAGILWLIWAAWPDKARLSVDKVAGAHPDITDPRDQTIPTMNVAKATGWPQGARPTPAPGLSVQAFATGLDHPRWLLTLPNGDVLVAESAAPAHQGGGIKDFVEEHLMKKAGADVASPDRIVLLRDANHDGIAETRSVLIGGLRSPFGMALDRGYLYIGDTDALLRVPFTPGQTTISAKPELVVPLPHGGEHWTRNVLASPNGNTLFVTVGSSTNIADNGLAAEKDRADILEVDPTTKTYRIYAAGLRNPNGLAYDPRSGRLWAAVNERDMAGSDGPPDYMSAIELGDFFGWPWYYWGGFPDARVQPMNQEMQPYSKRPDYALGPHVAALGLAFAEGSSLGARFGYGAFVGEHGSWNRVPASGYKLVYVPFAANGFPVPGAKPVDVLTGFLSPNGKRAYGRPVGVAIGPGGGLLVADDVGNTVWRVSAGGR